MLTTGTKAPDFTLSTATPEGPKQITLSDEIGKKNILLLFVPMAFTGVCTAELCDLSKSIGSYDSLDCTVYAVSGDNPFAQQAWAQKEGITVTLLSEIGLGMGGVPKRSAFLIDRSGIIRHAESHEDPKQLPDFVAIRTKLSELQ